MLFNRTSNYPIGLDISDLSLKMIQLNKRGVNTTIQCIGSFDLPEGIIEKGEIKNFDEAVKAINTLISKPKFGRISSRTVVACLPETKTFIKLIEIEKGPNDIRSIIQPEIEKHIPFGIKEIYFDWQVVEDSETTQTVLFGAVTRSVADEYIALLNASKLSVEALEIESNSISRALLKEESPEKTPDITNYGILDIGAKRTSMIFYSRDTILFTVSMPISGKQITEQIAKVLEVDTDQAEKAKLICGLDENKAQGVIKKILSDNINELVAKINQSVSFYSSHFPSRGKIDSIILCGGGSNIKKLTDIINAGTGIETVLGDTFINLKVKQNIKNNFNEVHELKEDFFNTDSPNHAKVITISQDSSLSYTTAMGLALRNIFIK